MKLQAYINGKWINKDTYVDIINPTTGEVAYQAPSLETNDIEQAYDSASKSFKIWSKLNIIERAKFCNKWADNLLENKEKIAKVMMNEIAKNYSDSLVEVERTVEYIRFTIEEAIRVQPRALTGSAAGNDNKYNFIQRVPLGVVLCISPFNYPINLAVSKIVPALITGNTIVFKGATQGTACAYELTKTIDEANFPEGVFNFVTGKGSVIGDALVENKNIAAISFTGGTKTGINLSKQSKMVPLILELGGKDSAIIADDIKSSDDIKNVATEIIKGAFSYSGQRCTAIKRIFVLNDIADELVGYLKEETEKLSVGTPEENTTITPVIDNGSADFIMGLISDAKSKGAKILTGDKREGNLIWPTLIDNVTEEMDVAWEEPFGPVVPVIRVNDINQAIELSNKSEFGLQGTIFTNDFNSAFNIANQLDTGTVNINAASSRGPDYFPFIGVKNSGLGIQGIPESLASMTREKGLVFNVKK